MRQIFYDTHAHLDFPDFEKDLPEVIDRAVSAGIERMIGVSTDLQSATKLLEISERFPQVYVAVGVHPTHVMDAPEDVRPPLRSLAQHPRVVAIGETGLDFYRMPSRQGGTEEEDRPYRERQEAIYRQQLEIASELGLNVIIHQRESLSETVRQLEPFAGRVRGVFHCFVGNVEEMQEILALGSLVSFTGIVTFKNAESVRETLRQTPLDKFMLETDSPFLAPVPYRGKRCEPAYVKDLASAVQDVKLCDAQTLSTATCRTAKEFFFKMK